MKKIVLACMAALMIATSATAMSVPIDNDGMKDFSSFEDQVTIQHEEVVVERISDWDLFFGTTLKDALEEFEVKLDPKNSGWNDFWFQCSDPNKTIWDCTGTVASGVGMVIFAPIVFGTIATTGLAVLVSAVPSAGTALGVPVGLTWSGSVVYM